MMRSGSARAFLVMVVLSGGPAALASPAVDLEDIPAAPAPPIPYDEPGATSQLIRRPSPPRTGLPWQLRVSMSVTSGVVGATVIGWDNALAAAYLGGDLRLLWSHPGKRWAMGLRISGSKALGMKDSLGRSQDSSGAEVSYLFETHGFWVSTGVGFAYYAGTDNLIMNGRSGGTFSWYLPEVHVALGYDIPLGRRLAVRLSGSVSTLLVTARAQLGAGLVVRF